MTTQGVTREERAALLGRDGMEQHFVTFYSPGTIVAETTEKKIDSWDVTKAQEMAKNIKERHGALPYGFRFTTRSRKDNELDSKVSESSGMYYLGGKVLTLQDIRTLISNMECNGWKKVIQNDNSWRWIQPLEEDDVVLTVAKARGDTP